MSSSDDSFSPEHPSGQPGDARPLFEPGSSGDLSPVPLSYATEEPGHFEVATQANRDLWWKIARVCAVLFLAAVIVLAVLSLLQLQLLLPAVAAFVSGLLHMFSKEMARTLSKPIQSAFIHAAGFVLASIATLCCCGPGVLKGEDSTPLLVRLLLAFIAIALAALVYLPQALSAHPPEPISESSFP